MKDVYNPDQQDILEWANSKSCKWPASDWDYYVMGGNYDNDLLVYQLANDESCLHKSFFVHALYYFVGDYFNEAARMKSGLSKARLDSKKKRIQNLLGIVKSDSKASSELRLWLKDVERLLGKRLPFDVDHWM
jgi:hypothetical protein